MRPLGFIIETGDMLGIDDAGRIRRWDDMKREREADMYFAATCKRREPLYPSLYFMLLVTALIVLACTLRGHGAELDPQRAAVVKILTPGGQGSGVCISSSGVIVTAAHVINQPVTGEWAPRGSIRTPVSVDVIFPDRPKLQARVVSVSHTAEDLAIVQCAGNNYPAVGLAATSPAVGDYVVSLGYPAGRFARLEGEVSSVGMTADKSRDVITAWGRPNPGHSGGALLDSRGNLVGICSMGTMDVATWCGAVQRTDQAGMYCRVEAIHGMLAQAGLQATSNGKSKQRLKIKVYVRQKCPPCEKLKRDIEAGRIKINGSQLSAQCDVYWCDAEKMPKETAAAGITAWPTILCVDTGERIEGYVDAECFALQMGVIIGSDAPEFVPRPERPRLFPDGGDSGRSAPTPTPPTPPVEAAAADPAADEIDGTGLRVVLMVRKLDLGLMQGWAVQAAETFAERGLKSKINAVLGGKAEIDVCFERTQPARFASLSKLIGLGADRKAAVIVLAATRFKGVLGTVAERIEAKLKSLTDGDWRVAKVETIYQRTEGEYYDQVVEALDQSSSVSAAGGGDQSWLAMIITAITSTLAGLRDGFLGHRLKVAKT